MKIIEKNQIYMRIHQDTYYLLLKNNTQKLNIPSYQEKDQITNKGKSNHNITKSPDQPLEKLKMDTPDVKETNGSPEYNEGYKEENRSMMINIEFSMYSLRPFFVNI